MSLYQQHPDRDAGDNPPFNTADTTAGSTARGGSGSGAILWAVLAVLAIVVVLWALFSFVF